MQRGDLRTPEGLFTIEGRNPMSKFYKALRISYPDVRHVSRAAQLGVSAGAAGWVLTANLLAAGGYDAVLPIGDLQYECGQASAYQAVYDPSWGRVKAISHPAVGDNEYTGNGCSTSGASGYFGYFGAAATPLQPGCRSGCQRFGFTSRSGGLTGR